MAIGIVTQTIGGFGDLFFCVKLARLLESQNQVNEPVVLVVNDGDKKTLESFLGNSSGEYKFTLKTPKEIQEQSESFSLLIGAPVVGGVWRSVVDVLPNSPKKIPVIPITEYGHKNKTSSGNEILSYDEAGNKLQILETHLSGFASYEEGVLSLTESGEEKRASEIAKEIKLNMPDAVLMTQYAHEKVAIGTPTANFLLLAALKDPKKDHALVLVGTSTEAKKKIFLEVKDKIVAQGYAHVRCIDLDTEPPEEDMLFSDASKTGPTYTVYLKKKVPHTELQALFDESGLIQATGDQSFIEALSVSTRDFSKLVSYETIGHKQRFISDFKNEIAKLIIYNHKLSDEQKDSAITLVDNLVSHQTQVDSLSLDEQEGLAFLLNDSELHQAIHEAYQGLLSQSQLATHLSSFINKTLESAPTPLESTLKLLEQSTRLHSWRVSHLLLVAPNVTAVSLKGYLVPVPDKYKNKFNKGGLKLLYSGADGKLSQNRTPDGRPNFLVTEMSDVISLLQTLAMDDDEEQQFLERAFTHLQPRLKALLQTKDGVSSAFEIFEDEAQKKQIIECIAADAMLIEQYVNLYPNNLAELIPYIQDFSQIALELRGRELTGAEKSAIAKRIETAEDAGQFLEPLRLTQRSDVLALVKPSVLQKLNTDKESEDTIGKPSRDRGENFRELKERYQKIREALPSVHSDNDLGDREAITLPAIRG